jgi:hypothetical protein
MSQSNVGGHALSEEREAGGVSAANAATAFSAAATADANRVVVMTRLAERANGERMIGQTQRKITDLPTAVGASTADTVVSETVQLGREAAACARVWWRRTLAAKNFLTSVGGGARIGFNLFSGGDTIAFTHRSNSVSDNGDGSYDVYQYAVAGTFFSVSKFDNEGEIVDEAYEVFIRTSSGYLTYTRKLRVVRRQLFSTAAAAADYADRSETSISDDPKMAGDVYIALPAMVKYAGNNRWWGYRVVFTDPSTAWSLGT